LVNPLEIYQMLAAIANRGQIYTPHFLKTIENEHGEVIERYLPKEKKQIGLHPETWETLIRGMRKAVTEGTGRIKRLNRSVGKWVQRIFEQLIPFFLANPPGKKVWIVSRLICHNQHFTIGWITNQNDSTSTGKQLITIFLHL